MPDFLSNFIIRPQPELWILLSAALLLVSPVPAFSADHEPAAHEESAVVNEATSPDESSGAFLLVIPGAGLVGTGVGMVIWGAIVSFR